MLKDDFYTITSINMEGNVIAATLVINAKHEIFDGHFPGQPVVPGVCMMQMVKEITGIALVKDLQLIKGNELKFLQIIDPRENKEINIRVQYNELQRDIINVLASLFIENVQCFKFKGTFKSHNHQQ